MIVGVLSLIDMIDMHLYCHGNITQSGSVYVSVFAVVMSEEEIMERRIRLKRKKMLSTPVQLSSQQEETIRELVCGHHKTFDPAFYRFSGFRVR